MALHTQRTVVVELIINLTSRLEQNRISQRRLLPDYHGLAGDIARKSKTDSFGFVFFGPLARQRCRYRG